MLHDGLYEQVISKALNDELKKTDKYRETGQIDEAEAAKVLADYVAEVAQKGLETIKDNGGDLSAQVEMVNALVSAIEIKTSEEDFGNMSVAERAEQLLALFDTKNTLLAIDEKAKVTRPETSISQSSLFTGAVREPQMDMELKKEIASSDRIDMLVSFIKWSGLVRIIEELKAFTQRGGTLRIITTSYMGATDVKAVDELSKLLNTKIKVSYDTKITRLHAKAYVFYRDTGFTTAYIGSSNLSKAALTSGLEWNVKVTRKDLPETIDKIEATFESYWNSSEFEYYDEGSKERLARALKAEKFHDSNDAAAYTVDVRPYSYQQEILDKLEAEREVRGYKRNLVVAATGTGKTVISALDYKRYCDNNPGKPCRLLFVAHREEILKQSIATFRAVMKDGNFGDLFVGSYKPEQIDHLFISIQTFNSQEFTEKTSADYYDFIIVDEFHHAAAKTYQKLLNHYKPDILVGLTATPERMDGESVLQYFNDRIAAEIRLPEAIDRKLLCPFQYFGVTDTVDLNELKWSRGGYDIRELSNVYTVDQAVAEKRANQIINSLLQYVADIDEVKGLGFCVTVDHAKFMSRYFNKHNIPSMCLTGESSEDERAGAKKKLVSGEVKFIFAVDIYNEGVDIPEVNTILFLRPTESLTIFLQQLGRGLRHAEDKDCLTVLDFIGQANKKYNFEDKFAALLSNTTRSVQREIKDGFVSLPKGCFIQLEKMAAKYVLNNIRASFGKADGIISRIETFKEDSGQELTLGNFLNYHHMDPRAIYKHGTFARMCVRAGEREYFEDSEEEFYRKALQRFAVIDSRRWIDFLLDVLPRLSDVDIVKMKPAEQRMIQMFYATLWQEGAQDWNDEEVQKRIRNIVENKIFMNELVELLEYRYDQIDFVDKSVDLGFDCPLDLHCTYTRDQLFAALDFLKPKTVMEGVKWLEDKKLDVFLITLNKSDKDYSPTTMYKDYSINSQLFHWQSQGKTSDTSPTGQRYIHHIEQGTKVLLFVREYKNDKNYGTTEAYTYLGTANYVSHNGSKPMNIVWRLDEPIPAKFIKKTNKALIG